MNLSECGTILRGLLFVFLWYTSIIWSVYFLYCPLVPLLFLSRRTFRKCMDIILASWEMYPAALLEILMGCKVGLCGDWIQPGEGSIIIMNHRNRLDWFFLWAALLHATKPPAHRCKFILKSGVRRIPGIGWGLQLAGFLFIHRNWDKDQRLLVRSLDYFKDLGMDYQILIFPEGTDLTESSIAKSNAYALDNGGEPYNYVLHPRTTGFCYLVNKMRENSQLSRIYDMTIGYPKTLPHSETDILLGKIPEEVHFHIKSHDISSLPTDEAGVKAWIESRWAEKERTLEKYYNDRIGADPNQPIPFSSSPPIFEIPWNAMYFALVFWTCWTAFTMYLTFTSWFWFGWVAGCTILFILISQFTDGIQQLEIWFHEWIKETSFQDEGSQSEPLGHSHDNRMKTRNDESPLRQALGSGDSTNTKLD